MRSVALAAALFILAPSAASAGDCMDDAVTQAQMEACAKKSYAASDAELNKLYHQIEHRLHDDPATKKRLVAAQRAWIAFRDAECALVQTDDGSDSAMVHSLCLDKLTRARVADFQWYLSCGDQGDLSCPIPAAD